MSESIYILDNLSMHAMVIKCVLVVGPGGGQGRQGALNFLHQ